MSHTNNEPLISVVVPVYNVEKYIDRCMRSILNQTYRNIEVLLIDDGSPDKCPQICDDYAAKDNRIKVIHKQNGGLASARNNGVLNASGDYICFVDSDDWIDTNTFEYGIQLIMKEPQKVDIVQYGIELALNENHKNKRTKERITKYEGKEILNHLMIMSTKTDSYFSVCRCLFRADLLKKESFPEGRINEDIAYKYRVFSKASILIDSTLPKYYYFQNNGSITTEGFKSRDLDLYVAAIELKSMTEKEEYGKIKFLGNVKYARTSLSLLCKIAFYGICDEQIDKKTIVKKLQTELRKSLWLLIRSPIPVSRKFCAVLLSINIKCLEAPLGAYKKIRGASIGL